MFGFYTINPDESLCVSIAWNLWTHGHLATDLLAGALPGIEHHVYWTPPLYYLVLGLWQGLWGPGLLAARCLSLFLGAGLLLVLGLGRRRVTTGAWVAAALVVFDPLLQRIASMARMDMLAIFLTAAALTALETGRSSRRTALAGVLAAGAMLTHPLGAAAMVAGSATCLRRGRIAVRAFALGSVPPILAWVGYVALDPALFLTQMQLQFAVKADRAASVLDNLQRYARHYDRYLALALAFFGGGMAGLVLERRRLEPWLVGAAALVPVILFSGELIYPAYLVPFAAVGLCALLTRRHAARRAIAVAVAAVGLHLAAAPPPLAGIADGYEEYSRALGSFLGAGHRVVLGVVPDPWFVLRETRPDLELRLIPPVALPPKRLQDYVREADDVVLGGYNPPGIVDLVRNWDRTRRAGQKLWLMQLGRMYDFDDVRDEIVVQE